MLYKVLLEGGGRGKTLLTLQKSYGAQSSVEEHDLGEDRLTAPKNEIRM